MTPVIFSADSTDVSEVLRGCALLSDVPRADVDALAALVRAVPVERGEVIWLNGSRLDFFGVMHSGFVKMVKTTSNGREVTAELIGPGQVFGMLGVVDGTGCPLMARAATAGAYVRVHREAFLPFYSQHPSVRDSLMRRSGIRLRKAYDAIAMMSTGRVDQRMAAVLLALADSFGERGSHGVRITPPLARQDVADLAGTTLESAIRTLSRWERDQITRTDRRNITILQESALEGIVLGRGGK